MVDENTHTFWRAIYKDKTCLEQFDSNGKEHLFKEINQDKLFELQLCHHYNLISIFLDKGVFGINGLMYYTDISCLDVEYRPICFVRRQKILGTAGTPTNTAYIGFQITKDGKNHKRTISIYDYEIKFHKV